ncbi:MAG: CBS domain-containing protein [Burkholderiales bacterium]|nr:CBS domain-containing protein [Burkholderiales bacterium]
MRVSEAMTREVRVTEPNQTIREAARQMAAIDAGALPVGENDRLVGMITDRDIAVRAVALGLGPDTRVRDVMSQEVLYCHEDDTVEHVAGNMGDMQVRRMPVVDEDKRLVGIVSIGDLAQCEPGHNTGQAMAGITRQGGAHSQAAAL